MKLYFPNTELFRLRKICTRKTFKLKQNRNFENEFNFGLTSFASYEWTFLDRRIVLYEAIKSVYVHLFFTQRKNYVIFRIVLEIFSTKFYCFHSASLFRWRKRFVRSLSLSLSITLAVRKFFHILLPSLITHRSLPFRVRSSLKRGNKTKHQNKNSHVLCRMSNSAENSSTKIINAIVYWNNSCLFFVSIMNFNQIFEHVLFC